MFDKKLKVQKSALFLTPKKKRVAQKVIAEALNKCSAHRTGEPIKMVVRKSAYIKERPVNISYIIFNFSREPAFLHGSGLTDVLHGFVAFVEVGEICAVFSSRALDPWKHLTKSFDKLDHPVLTKVFVSADTAYESMSMDTISLSKHSIRARKLEADDLRNSLPLTSAGTSVPRNIRLRLQDGIFRIGNRTSRIAKRDPPAELEDLIHFCISVEEQIRRPRPEGLFIDNFSEPVSLESLPKNVVPVGLLIPMFEVGKMLDRGEIRSISIGRSKDRRRPMSAGSISRLLENYTKVMEVRKVGSEHLAFREMGGGGEYHKFSSGQVRINRKTITVRGGIFSVVWLEMNDGQVHRLESYLNLEKNFIISFSDAIHAYYNDRLYKNKGIIANADFLLSVITAESALDAAWDEKGKTFTAEQTSFKEGTLFSITETHLCASDPVVICDDLGEEIADYIAVDADASPPHISFYHCKHRPKSLSASYFHEVVSQALKNIGSLSGDGSAMTSKIGKFWSKCYNADKVQTGIARIRRGTADDAAFHIRKAISSVNCARRMVIVVSFLSLKDLKAAIEDLRAQRTAPFQVTQMLWLILSFISTCRDAAVEPRIVTRS